MNPALNLPPRIRPAFRWSWWAPLTVLGLALGGLLFVVDPAQRSIFPPCIFHELTGWSCPGCGGTRAVHQLLHGHWVEAFRLNPVFVLLLPGLLYWGVRELVWQAGGRRWPFPEVKPAWGWVLVGVIVVFSVLRNLPLPMMEWLRLP